MIDAIAIIPARYGSSRFPGKPLATLAGKPVIEHVYRRASKAFDLVIVATDDLRIFRAVEEFGGRAVMTSPGLPNGTVRCAEALAKLNIAPRVVVNVQGDEPFVDPDDLKRVAEACANSLDGIATMARLFDPEEGIEALLDPSNVKLVVDKSNHALYFSRSAIPFVRDVENRQWLESTQFLIHNGIYAFRPATLQRCISLPNSALEKAERLEQLRWLENSMTIDVVLTKNKSIGIDTPDDLHRAHQIINQQ